MKNRNNSSVGGNNKTDRESRQAEALRANLRRRKAFSLNKPGKAISAAGQCPAPVEKPDG